MNYSKLNIRSTYNRQTSIRKPRLGAALAAEQLDDRVLLSVASSQVGDQLQIQIVPNDSRLTAYIRQQGGNIDVADNANFSGAISYLSSSITGVNISGSGSADAIMFTGGSIPATLFTNMVDSVSFTGGSSFTGSIGIANANASTSLSNLFSTNGFITTSVSGGGLQLSGSFVAAQGVLLNAPVVLQSDVSIDGGAGNVQFGSTVDATAAGGQSLKVTSPASTIFTGAVGSNVALKSITTQSVTPLSAPIVPNQSTTIPISYLPQADSGSTPAIKYGIDVAIGDGNPARTYLFDTGGTAFWAAYDASASNGLSVNANAPVQNLYTSGIFYSGLVTSGNVTIGTGPNAVTTAQPVNFATWAQGGTQQNPDGWFFPAQKSSTGTLYGDFGAAFGINTDVANSPLTSILFQLPGNYSSGYTVRLGPVGGPACLTIGITDELRQQFPYAIPLTALANTTYPVSNLQAYADFAYSPDYILSNGTQTYNLGTLPTISDTGAPSTSIRYPNPTANLPGPFPFLDGANNILPGTVLTAVMPTAPGYPALSWTQLIGNQQSVNKAGYLDRTGAATDVNNVNTGLNLFSQYDVMMDVAQGLLRLRPNAGIGTVTIGSVTTTGDQNFNQNVNFGGSAKSTGGGINVGGKAYLTGDVSISTNNSPITFQNTIDGDFSLVINSNSTVTFGSNVGAYEKLKQITVAAGQTVMPQVSVPTVATFGPQSYSGDTLLNGTVQSTDREIEFRGNVTLVGSSSVVSKKSNISFSSGINGGNTLSVSAAGNVTFYDRIGERVPVGGLVLDAKYVLGKSTIKLSGASSGAQPDGLVITDNTTVDLNLPGSLVTGFSGNGLLFNGSSGNSRISGFTISDNVNNGIRFSSASGAATNFSGTVISDNTIIGNGQFGVEFSAPVKGLRLEKNTIGQAGSVNPWGFTSGGSNTHGIVLGTGSYTGTAISQNDITNNKRDGIYAPLGVQSLSIMQNNISINGGHGIEFFTGDFTGTVISENTISNNAENGIALGAGIIPPVGGGDPNTGYTGNLATSGHYILDYSTSPLVNGLVKNDPKIAISSPIFHGSGNSTTVNIPLDTGSRGLYLALPMIRPGTSLGNETGYVYLNSSNRIYYGNWVNQSITFPQSHYVDSNHSPVMNQQATANLPVLVVTAIGATNTPQPGSSVAETTFGTNIDSGNITITNGTQTKIVSINNGVVTIPGGWWANYADNLTSDGKYKLGDVANFGIGFDRSGQGTSPVNAGVNQGYNAFLSLAEMQNGTMRAGYVITPQNIILGLDHSISGYSYTDLTPTGIAQAPNSPPDWQPATGTLHYGNITYGPGPIVIDMGIPSGILTLPGQSVTSPFNQQLTVNLLNSGGKIAYNINYNNANNALNPTSVSFFNPLAGNYSENAPGQNNQFFNTGRYVFSAFNYLYDATGGYLGLKPVNPSVLSSANGTYPADAAYFANPQSPTGVTNLTIGADNSSGGNSISDNGQYGVYINGAGSSGVHYSNNIISDNGIGGVQLAGGANGGQQSPVLTSSSGYSTDQTLVVSGVLPEDPNYHGHYTVQFFAGDSNATGQPIDAALPLGSITVPAGNFSTSFIVDRSAFGRSIIATATPLAGPRNTSAFSVGSMVSTIIVKSNADSGPTSLREAITIGNGYSFAKTISFQVKKPDNTITLKTPLPALTATTVLDGRNYDDQASYINHIWIDGSKLKGSKPDGLRIEPSAAGSVVKHMGFRSFRRGNAIAVKANDVTIRDNRLHEGHTGLNLNNATGMDVINNTITRFGHGIYATGNLQGSLVDGNTINYNRRAGIRLENATGIAIGLPGSGNDICGTEKSYHFAAGIQASGLLTGTTIQSNRIQSGGNGIVMQKARGLQVGGSVSMPLVGGNSIFKNRGVGLFASGDSTGSAVRGNSITSNHRDISISNAKNLSFIAGPNYISPFKMTLDPQITEWTSDFESRSALIMQNSQPAPADWYTFNYNSQSYGPLNPQLLSATASESQGLNPANDRGPAVNNSGPINPPTGVDLRYWQQQRLLAAAASLIGTPYQHLHLPQFNPGNVPTGNFPWSSVSQNADLQTSPMLLANTTLPTVANPYLQAYGKPTEGIDCTDFAAYIYNLALGIQMYSGVSSQINFSLNGQPSGPVAGAVASAYVLAADGSAITPKFYYANTFGEYDYNRPGTLDDVIKHLQPGDLLYIGNPGGVLHVVVWMGINGTDSAGNTFPLVISSHDNTPAIFDTEAVDPVTGFPTDNNIQGHLPPPGVQILPFVASNWFYQDFLVAMRVLKG